MATKVILGGVVFTPGPRNKISFNNPRVIAKVDVPGAEPVNQDMGPDETTLSWSGYLAGDNAYTKAIKIESMKDAGQVVQLIVTGYPELCKKVRIRSFPWSLIRSNRIEYTIDLVAEMEQSDVDAVATSVIDSGSSSDSSATTAAVGQSYTIKQGDTLWDLATTYLGAGTRWKEIASLNNVLDPRALAIGQTIKIPTTG